MVRARRARVDRQSYEYEVTSPDWIGNAYDSTHGAYGTLWFATLQNRVELSSPVSVMPVDHSSPRRGVRAASPRQHACNEPNNGFVFCGA